MVSVENRPPIMGLFSSTSVRKPSLTASAPAHMPPIPPPITTTSYFCSAILKPPPCQMLFTLLALVFTCVNMLASPWGSKPDRDHPHCAGEGLDQVEMPSSDTEQRPSRTPSSGCGTRSASSSPPPRSPGTCWHAGQP